MDDNGKTILVTGAAGFIGAFLSRRLMECGYRVVGYDNLNSYYDVSLKRERLAMIAQAGADGNRFSFVEADLCDRDALEAVFREHRPGIVVNLAAQAGVRYSIDHPRDYLESNVVGFFNILEACRQYEVEHLVYASSSSVYGDAEAVPFVESAPCNEPVSLYAATKKSDELMAHAYAAIYGLPCTGLRFFTVYGPMGRPDMAYFSFARNMMAGSPIQLFNNGNMLRDFTYVDDIVEGIARIVERGLIPPTGNTPPARVFNIGHGEPVPLRDFVDELEGALRRHGLLAQPVTYELLPMQRGDVHRTFASTAALQEAYGYAPTTPLSDGMDAFAAWLASRDASA